MSTLLLIVLCIIFIVVTSTRFKVHPFLSLLSAAFLFGLFSGMPLKDIVDAINSGFGNTIGSIGIIIIIGIVIGTFLEESGGVSRLAAVVIKIVGKGRIHRAMAAIGYLVSIPVFADSGFVILSSLNRAITRKAGLSLAGTAIALSLGLTATHTMVPPTPGPIAAAGILSADLGLVIMLGGIVSSAALIICTLFARKMGERIYIEPKAATKDLPEKKDEVPGAFHSFLPIIIPIILIVIRSFAMLPAAPLGSGKTIDLLIFAGNPVVALFAGMLIAFTLPRRFDRNTLSASGWVGKSLKSAAIILMITGAGGAFGRILQYSDLGSLLEEHAAAGQLGIWVPFLVAAVMKTAQGSSTVALITASGIVLPLIPGLGLDSDFGRATAVIAIGAGSAVISHVNDSFFWVVTQFSDMDIRQGYRLQSAGTALLGLSAMAALTIINLIFGS